MDGLKTKAYNYAIGKSSASVFIEAHAKDFTAGYEQAIEYTIKNNDNSYKIKELLQLIDECKDIERETKTSYFLCDEQGIERNKIAKKLRKKTEKAIFKILEDQELKTECNHDLETCGTRAVKCLKCKEIFENYL